MSLWSVNRLLKFSKQCVWLGLTYANQLLNLLARISLSRDLQWQPAAAADCEVGADYGVVPLTLPTLEQTPSLQFQSYPGDTGILIVQGARLDFLKHNFAPIRDHDEHGRLVFVKNRYGLPIDIGYPQAWLPHKLSTVQTGSLGKLAGKVALLGGYWGDSKNYYHFVADTLGDLAFLRRQGLDLAQFNHFVLPFSGSAWQKTLWQLAGISLDKIVPVSKFAKLHVQTLYVPVRAKGSRYTPSWLAAELRKQLGFQLSAAKPEALLYISRKDAPQRALANEDNIINLLQRRGFTIVECSALSVQQQQQLFNQAKIIVAPHGAALTNLIWCQPGTMVIELIPPFHPNPCFAELSVLADLHYRYLAGESRLINQQQTFVFEQTDTLMQWVDELIATAGLAKVH
jgi:hypothetical protein